MSSEWLTTDRPDVVACMGSVPECAAWGCQARIIRSRVDAEAAQWHGLLNALQAQRDGLQDQVDYLTEERYALLCNVLEKEHDVEQLRAEVMALTARLQALTGYVQHKPECAVRYFSSYDCTCGLADLLTPASAEEPEK